MYNITELFFLIILPFARIGYRCYSDTNPYLLQTKLSGFFIAASRFKKPNKGQGNNNSNIVFGSTSNWKSRPAGVARGSKKANVKVDIDEYYSEEKDDDEEEYSNQA